MFLETSELREDNILNTYLFKRLWGILGSLVGYKSQNDLGVYKWKHWENVYRPKHRCILKLYYSRIIEIIIIIIHFNGLKIYKGV